MNLNRQIEDWIKSRISQFDAPSRPFVTLAYAQSLDGSISSKIGEPLVLSGEEASCLTHQLRSLHDGILVGIETVLADNPQLTVRMWEGENPQPIVLDSLLRMPETARLCNHPDKKCWVMTARKMENLPERGFEILPVGEGEDARVPLNEALRVLHNKGITSIMVEGGATVITAFLEAGLVDAVVMTIAPAIVGGYKAVNKLNIDINGQIPIVDPLNSEMFGKDIIVWGDVQFEGKES